MNSELLYCPSCSEKYDLVHHLPRKIPKCNHRICSFCCSNHLESGSRFTCLFDGNTFHVPPQQGLDYFHVDFILKEIVAGNLRESINYTFPLPNKEQSQVNEPVRQENRPDLSIKEEDREFYEDIEAMEVQEMENRKAENEEVFKEFEELEELQRLEQEGQIEGSIQPEIERAAQDIEEKIKMLKDARLSLEINQEKAVQIVEKKRQMFLKNMKYRFEALQHFLKIKQMQAEREINGMFDECAEKVSSYVGVHSGLGQRIQGTITQYEKTLEAAELVNASKEDITGVLKDLSKENLEKRRDEMQRELEKSLGVYDDKLVGLGKGILGVSFPRDYLAKNLEKTAFEREEAMEEIIPYYNPVIKMGSNRDVKLSIFSNVLVISVTAARNSMVAQTQQMMNTQSQMRFSNHISSQVPSQIPSQIPSQMPSQIPSQAAISQGSVEMPKDWEKQTHVCLQLTKKMTETENAVYLANVLNNLEEIDGLKLACSDKAINDQSLTSFYPFISWSMTNLLTLNLLFGNSSVTDAGLVPFFENIFLYLSSLKSLFIDISQLRVSDKTIEAIAYGAESALKRLESFEIWTTQVALTDRGVTKLFMPFEKMKNFKLGFQNTRITSSCIRTFVNDSLLHMKNLESLVLLFSYMRVNDEDFDELFDALYKMSAKKIEEEEMFNMCCDLYGDDPLQSMEVDSISRLRNLVLNVSFTEFSDRGLARLTEHINKMRDLTSLEVYLGNTKVTDRGVMALLERLPPLKRLTISVIETGVTQRIAEVVERNVELVEMLERLDINLKNGRVRTLEQMKQSVTNNRQRNGRRV